MKKVYSVSELTKRIKESLEATFPQVWVEGEVSNLTRPVSGHLYFTLKDQDAQLQVVMFRQNNRSLSFDMTHGLKIIVCGRISVYERRGNYQLYAEIIEPKGIGALQLAFEQLKEKLQKEGLFDEAHKKEIPFLPRAIGVVTSPTGAAIRDILHIVNRRFNSAHIILNPVQVQGENAAGQIAQAIREFNEHGICDVLIVGRGGGSLEDLWAFNEEIVARAVYDSRIPVISAVGHEIDYTICDFVADLRAPTPSAAAELVVFRKEEWEEKVCLCQESLKRQIKSLIETRRLRLNALRKRYAFRMPLTVLHQYMQRLDEYLGRLSNGVRQAVQAKKSAFRNVVGKLDVLSPLGILSRGYSVSYHKDTRKILRTVADIRVSDFVTTRLQDGTIESKVSKIYKKV
ncbi:MAG: exodeoxyribonuclease VII large subunit [Candidatus Omnitrophica bacterium]|nr:exodeoxyribonuclease VII large subunit [Candidatus Omnitrophota bacterium]